MSDVKTYSIAGKTYEQRTLVYGQLLQLVEVLGDAKIPEGNDYRDMMRRLGDRLLPAVAVVLLEPGSTPEQIEARDLPTFAKRLKFTISISTLTEILRDFFICNPLADLIDQLIELVQLTGAFQMAAALPKTSKSSSSCLQEEIGPSAEPSSGDALPEPPNPGCESAGEPAQPASDC